MTSRVFTRVNIVAWVAAIGVLLFLFVYPHRSISAFEEDIGLLCNKLDTAVDAGEWEAALGLAEDLQARFNAERQRLRLFFDHEDVDELELCIKTAAAYIKQEEGPPALDELENVRGIASYLESIEKFTFTNVF